MFRIKDFEEKKCIIAYYKCNSNRNFNNIFVNSQIYAVWLEWWKDDFMLHDKCIQMYKQKLVISGAKWKQGIRPQEYEERTAVLSSVINWINTNYDKKLSRKGNRKKFHGMLIELRSGHLKDLTDKVSGSLYQIEEITDKNELKLRQYCLFDDKKSVVTGTYEEIIEYLIAKGVATAC